MELKTSNGCIKISKIALNVKLTAYVCVQNKTRTFLTSAAKKKKKSATASVRGVKKQRRLTCFSSSFVGGGCAGVKRKKLENCPALKLSVMTRPRAVREAEPGSESADRGGIRGELRASLQDADGPPSPPK